jgi:hypothetical protein
MVSSPSGVPIKLSEGIRGSYLKNINFLENDCCLAAKNLVKFSTGAVLGKNYNNFHSKLTLWI